MAFNKNKKIVTTALTAAMVASAVAPVAAAKVSVQQDATNKVNSYSKAVVRNAAEAKKAEGLQKAAQAAVAKLTSKKDANLKKSLQSKINAKAAAIKSVLANITAADKAVKAYEATNVKVEADYAKTATAKNNATKAVAKLVDVSAKASYTKRINNKATALKAAYDKLVAARTEAAAQKAVEEALKAAQALKVDEKTTQAQVDALYKSGKDLIAKVKDAAKKAQYTATLEKLYKDATDQVKFFATPQVASVTAINAKQVEVKFNRAIDADTVIDANGKLKAGVFKTNGTALAGLVHDASLSTDGKTLTITNDLTTSNTFAGTYLLELVKETVKTTTGAYVSAYAEKVSYTDSVAPTLVSVEKVDASHVKVNFSEPVKSYGTITAKLADGTVVSGIVPAISGKSVTLDLSAASVPASKDITLTFVGVLDYADNLANPNPVTAVTQKGAKDGVAPTVASITKVNAKKITVKFSEEVQGFVAGLVTAGGNVATSVEQSKTDKTSYTVTFATPISGIATVNIAAGFSDLSGEAGAATSKIVDFGTDTVKPTVTSAVVSKDASGLEVLTFTTSEDTTFTGGAVSLSTTRVKDYVTETGTLTFAAANVTAVTGTSNQFTVKLKDVSYNGSALTSGAKYTADLTAGLFTDTAGNANAAASSAVTFTRGTDSDSSKPVVDSIAIVDNNTLTVNFNAAVAVDGATATNKANYYVAGATVESATLIAGNKVTLKLAADSNAFSGVRTVKVSGVKAANNNVMAEYSTTLNLNENVRPTVTGVAVTSITPDDVTTPAVDESKSVVTLTLSENVDLGGADTADFDLYIKGAKATVTSIATSAGSSANKVVVTINGKALTGQDFADGVTLVAKSTIDIKDAAVNGNLINVASPIVVTLN